MNPDIKKITTVLAYLAQSVPGLTIQKAFCLMYFADKKHLIEYGRTVTGDNYKAYSKEDFEML